MNITTLQQIIKLAEARQSYNYQFQRNLEIYEGQFNKFVIQELQKDLSSESFSIESKKISSLNIIQRTTDKLSQVYSEKPERKPANKADEETFTELVKESSIDNVMLFSEIILNLNKTFALEPYYEQDKVLARELKIRLLKPDEFCLYSDDEFDKSKVTHFVKFLGQIIVKVQEKDEIRNLYSIYSKDEIVEIDSKMTIYSSIENIYNQIPFVVCKTSGFSINQVPDTDSYDTAVIIAKLLTGLNFGVHFQSHSTMYGIDIDMPQRVNNSPNAFWNLKSDINNANAKPSVGILSPTVKVSEVIELVKFYVSQFLEEKGIKPGNSGNSTNTNPMSAISKIIDEADTTEVLKFNKELLVKTEQSLWQLVSVIHNTLTRTGTLKTSKGLSKDFKVSIDFEPHQIQPAPSEVRESLKFQLDNSLITRKRAIQKLNPEFTPEQIDELLAELEAEEQNKNNVDTTNVVDTNNQDQKQ